MEPTQISRALRETAAVASGNLAVCRAKLKGAERSLAFAKEAAGLSPWGTGARWRGRLPVSASRGVSQSPPFVASEKYLKRVEIDGRLESVVKKRLGRHRRR